MANLNEKGWCSVSSKFCCRCIARHLCGDWKIAVGTDDDIISYFLKQHNIDSSWLGKRKDDSEASANEQQNTSNFYCCGCSNILSQDIITSCVNTIKDQVKDEHYEFSSFQLLVAMPLSMMIQDQVSIEVFKEHFGDMVEKQPFNVKEIFKNLLDSLVSNFLGVEREVDSDFEISVNVISEQDDVIVLPQLRDAAPQCFQNPKKKYFQYNKRKKCEDGRFTATQVKNALKQVDEVELRRICALLTKSCKLNIQLHHHPVYVGGRYNKYSRGLPQTPWLIDGVRKMEHCVEEFLALPLLRAFSADSYNFSSSGREDVDVRMLGNGRPFIVQLNNPRKATLSACALTDIEEEINAQTNDVMAAKLKIVKKSDCKLLKEGEVEKTKSYSAVCCFIEEPSPVQIEKLLQLSQITDLKLDQKTPIRVLHRRPLATRVRTIHSIIAERLDRDPRLFKLDLLTQAGTYIKEFVHGDFGRTKPSLKDLLDAEVDIIDLDVTLVNVNWPPPS